MHSPSFAIHQNLFDSFGIRQKNVGYRTQESLVYFYKDY